MKDEVTVSVCMITYNHEFYIKQAIEGVLMQKCNFSIKLVIGEDCSTDNTHQICKSYAKKYSQINLLQSESNLGIISNFLRTLNACNGKYIAICEGDDYWTDPYKLQKQVDFLEANMDYGLVYTDAAIYIEESNTFNKTFSSLFEEIPSSGNIFQHLLLRNCIPTLTVVTRRTILLEAIRCFADSINNFKMGDYPMWLEIARNSKIKYLNDITAVYRKSTQSASCYYDIEKRYDFLQSCYDIQFYFCKKYNELNVQNRLQIEYNRFLCNKAFDLKEKVTDKSVLRSFKPISNRDRLIKISLQIDFISFFIRNLFKIVAVSKIYRSK